MEFTPDGQTLFVSHPNSVIEITGPFHKPILDTNPTLGSVAGDVTNTIEKNPYSDLTIVALDGDKIVSSTKTDEDGTYQLMLPPGEFTVRPKRGQGMKSSDETVLTVSAGQESRADFTATPTKLPETLMRSMALYKSLEGYRDTTLVEMHMVRPGMDNRMTSQVLFAFEKPNRIRNESIIDSQMGGVDLFSEDGKIVSYMGRWKQYTEKDAPEVLTSANFQMVQSGIATNFIITGDPHEELQKNIEDAIEVSSEELNGSSTIIIDLTQPASSLGSNMVPGNLGDDLFITVRLWIGSNDYLIHKVEYNLDMEEIAKSFSKKNKR